MTAPAYGNLIDLDRLELFLQNLQTTFGGGGNTGTVVYDDAETLDGTTQSSTSTFTLAGDAASATRVLIEYKVVERPGNQFEQTRYGSVIVPIPTVQNASYLFETGTWTWGVTRASLSPYSLANHQFRVDLAAASTFTGQTEQTCYLTILQVTAL